MTAGSVVFEIEQNHRGFASHNHHHARRVAVVGSDRSGFVALRGALQQRRRVKTPQGGFVMAYGIEVTVYGTAGKHVFWLRGGNGTLLRFSDSSIAWGEAERLFRTMNGSDPKRRATFIVRPLPVLHEYAA